MDFAWKEDVLNLNREKNRAYLSALLLAEEGIQLVFRAGTVSLAVYLMGTLPFLSAAIYYWSTMTYDAQAASFASAGALALALLFVWMKACHARYGQHLRSALVDRELPPWTMGGFYRTLCRQAALQATVVVVYPVAMLVLIPMAYSVAWYQYLSILDDGGTTTLRQLARDAAGQAKLWPRQNHGLLWLASPLMVIAGGLIYLVTFPVLDGLSQEMDTASLFLSLGSIYGFIVLLAMLPLAPTATAFAVGIGSSLFFTIELFHVFSGADTLYTRNPGALLSNSTFIALICALTYMALDPVLKAAYVIRCHEGLSLVTGDDIRVTLRRLQKLTTKAASSVLILIALSFSFFVNTAGAEELPAAAPTSTTTTAQAAHLDTALKEELAQSRYTWRMPREPRPESEMPWLLQTITNFGRDFRDWAKSTLDWAQEKWEKFKKWIGGDKTEESSSGMMSGFSPSLRILFVVMGAILVLLAIYLIWRSYRKRPPQLLSSIAPLESVAPDLESESTTAADLPEDEWFRLAQQLAAAGDFRLAARALFFSLLATLGRREVIRIARFKSNMDYQNELSRRSSSLGSAPIDFSRIALIYESVWYGEHEANAAVLNQMQAHQERLRHAID